MSCTSDYLWCYVWIIGFFFLIRFTCVCHLLIVISHYPACLKLLSCAGCTLKNKVGTNVAIWMLFVISKASNAPIICIDDDSIVNIKWTFHILLLLYFPLKILAYQSLMILEESIAGRLDFCVLKLNNLMKLPCKTVTECYDEYKTISC